LNHGLLLAGFSRCCRRRDRGAAGGFS